MDYPIIEGNNLGTLWMENVDSETYFMIHEGRHGAGWPVCDKVQHFDLQSIRSIQLWVAESFFWSSTPTDGGAAWGSDELVFRRARHRLPSVVQVDVGDLSRLNSHRDVDG